MNRTMAYHLARRVNNPTAQDTWAFFLWAQVIRVDEIHFRVAILDTYSGQWDVYDSPTDLGEVITLYKREWEEIV